MAEGHRGRLKYRFQAEGLSNFDPHTALELLLFYVIPRRDTNLIAHRLVDAFGSFSNVLDAPLEELQKVEGIGENTALFLKMIPQLSSYYLTDRAEVRRQIGSASEAGDYLLPRFIGKTNEQVYLLCMDNAGKILYGSFIHQGTVNFAALSPRTVAEIALRVGASRIIIAHNHPHGFAIPSKQDVSSTNALLRALQPLGIHLADHLIIANQDFVSLAESGCLSSL